MLDFRTFSLNYLHSLKNAQRETGYSFEDNEQSVALGTPLEALAPPIMFHLHFPSMLTDNEPYLSHSLYFLRKKKLKWSSPFSIVLVLLFIFPVFLFLFFFLFALQTKPVEENDKLYHIEENLIQIKLWVPEANKMLKLQGR